MAGISQRQKRLSNLRKRIAEPQDAYERCRLYPCANRTTADRGEGLNRLYCRKHIEFYRRHGSYVKRSYGAGELHAYRLGALVWLQRRADDASVRSAIAEVERLYRSAGAAMEAFRLAGKTPADRARAVWAQLRKREVDPLKIIAAWIAIAQRLGDDSHPDRHEEYKQVQAAKVVHRLAGGTHKRWEYDGRNGVVESTEIHKYPVSRGQVLRVLGRQLAKACGSLTVDCPAPRDPDVGASDQSY